MQLDGNAVGWQDAKYVATMAGGGINETAGQVDTLVCIGIS
jgi:hypothetical protein